MPFLFLWDLPSETAAGPNAALKAFPDFKPQLQACPAALGTVRGSNSHWLKYASEISIAALPGHLCWAWLLGWAAGDGSALGILSPPPACAGNFSFCAF